MHPAVTFSYYAGSIFLLIFLLHPVILLAGFLMILLLNVTKGHFPFLKKWLFFMITSGVFLLILNPIFNERGRTVLFVVNEHRITLEAVLYGGMSALSLMSVIALFVSYNEEMTPNKLLFLFSKFMPQFAVLLMLTLRFIPLLRRRLDDISAVQMSKGLSVRNGRWRDRARTGMLYIQTLLTFSLEEAIQTADSMKARGYGKAERSSYEYYIFRKSDALSFLYLLLILFYLIYERSNGYGFLEIYPIMEEVQLSGHDTSVLIASQLFYSFPMITVLGGKLRWRLFS